MMQEFVQEIQNTVQRGLRGIHTAMPGQIVSFDPPDSQGRLRDDFCARSHRRGKPDCDRQPVVLGP